MTANAKANNERHFVQVPMPDWMFDAWKQYARDKSMEVKALMEQFIDAFLIEKQAYDGTGGKYVILYASPANSKPRSMWISSNHFKRIEQFAQTHDTRVNRVVFSACLNGLVKGHRVEI